MGSETALQCVDLIHIIFRSQVSMSDSRVPS